MIQIVNIVLVNMTENAQFAIQGIVWVMEDVNLQIIVMIAIASNAQVQ